MTTVLRRLRLQRGLTMRELAAEVGVGHVTIFRIEHGAGCHPRTRLALERALGVPFDVLTLPDTTNAAVPKDSGAGAMSHRDQTGTPHGF